jgi:hypothetical protein
MRLYAQTNGDYNSAKQLQQDAQQLVNAGRN